MIRDWLHGASARRKFASLRRAMIALQANFQRKQNLALLSDEEEDRLLSIFEQFVRYIGHRLQETEDELFEARSQPRF